MSFIIALKINDEVKNACLGTQQKKKLVSEAWWRNSSRLRLSEKVVRLTIRRIAGEKQAEF